MDKAFSEMGPLLGGMGQILAMVLVEGDRTKTSCSIVHHMLFSGRLLSYYASVKKQNLSFSLYILSFSHLN